MDVDAAGDRFVVHASALQPTEGEIARTVQRLGFRPELHPPPAPETRPGQPGPLPPALQVRLASAAGRTLVVEVGATWCAPCRAMAPVWADPSVRQGLTGRELWTVDADEQPEVAQWLQVTTLPVALAVAGEGRVIARLEGVVPASEVVAWLQSLP